MKTHTTLSKYLESNRPNLSSFAAILGYEIVREYREQFGDSPKKIDSIELNSQGEKEEMRVNIYPSDWLEIQAQGFDTILRLWQKRHEANQRKRVKAKQDAAQKPKRKKRVRMKVQLIK